MIQQKNPAFKISSLVDSVRSMEDENRTIMNFLSNFFLIYRLINIKNENS
jgi:hypothetical protein